MNQWCCWRWKTDEATRRRAKLATIAVVAVLASVTLAGCSMGSGAALSNAHVELAEDSGPVVEFNYSVDDYSTVLLEAPDGEMISDTEISPENEQARVWLGEGEPGEYTLVLQQGGETTTTETLTFEGGSIEVTDVMAEWSGDTLEAVSATVENTGDLPVQVQNATYSARGESRDSGVLYKWVPAGSAMTLDLTSTYGASITVEEQGEVQGEVELRTSNGPVTGTFGKTFQGANVTITQANGTWSGNELQSVEVTVQNTGDLPTTVNATINHESESLVSTHSEELPVGETTSIEIDPYDGIYWAESGGEIRIDVVANSPSGDSTETLTHSIEEADVSLDSMEQFWQEERLSGVIFTVANDGEVASDFTAEVTVNGEVVREKTFSIEPSETTEYQLLPTSYSEPLFTAESGGSYDVALSISGDGWSDSATRTATFEDPDAAITSINPSVYENYGENTFDLSSVNVAVENTGGLSLTFDSAELTIDGTTKTESLTLEREIRGGSTGTVNLRPDVTVEAGTYDLTVRLLDDGNVVLTKTTTVSTSN